MSDEERTFKVSMKREEGFVFKVDFGIPEFDFIMDEPEPVGANKGPNASKVLAAAMGNCLTASLMFCLQKARAEIGEVETKVEGKMRRNEKGRWRIAEVNIEINPEIEFDSLPVSDTIAIERITFYYYLLFPEKNRARIHLKNEDNKWFARAIFIPDSEARPEQYIASDGTYYVFYPRSALSDVIDMLRNEPWVYLRYHANGRDTWIGT